MKKFVAVLLGALLGAAVVLIIVFRNDLTAFVPKDLFKIGPAPSASGAVEPEAEAAVDEAGLIGIWHVLPSIPAGWSDHYHFYKDGTFRLDYNQMDGEKRLFSEFGLWKLVDNFLVLEITSRKVLKGGTLVEASGSVATRYEIQGGELVDEAVSPPGTRRYMLNRIVADREHGLPRIELNGRKYWRIANANNSK
jgi:hypothetical protein